MEGDVLAQPARARLGVPRARRAQLLNGVEDGAVEGGGDLRGNTSMQRVTAVTCCCETEAARSQAEEVVANREPGSPRRRRRGALPTARATPATRSAASTPYAHSRARSSSPPTKAPSDLRGVAACRQ